MITGVGWWISRSSDYRRAGEFLRRRQYRCLEKDTNGRIRDACAPEHLDWRHAGTHRRGDEARYEKR
jgi:hypothetical protein